MTALIAADTSDAAWVWPKSWAEYQLETRFPGTTIVCVPMGAPVRQSGINSYGEFSCGIVIGAGYPNYLVVLKPRSRAAYTIVAIRKIGSSGASAGGGIYAATGSGHWITDKTLDGSVITLEDGSRWLVSPFARIDTILWLVVDDITVIDGTDPSYPFDLVNTDENETASARFLGF